MTTADNRITAHGEQSGRPGRRRTGSPRTIGSTVLVLPLLLVGACAADPATAPTATSSVGPLPAAPNPALDDRWLSVATVPRADRPDPPAAATGVSQVRPVGTAPLTMTPTPQTAQHPRAAPLTDPSIEPAHPPDRDADPLTVASAFAWAWWRVDTADTDAWARQVGPLTTGDLQQHLRDFAPRDGQPPGVSTPTIRLVAQRSAPPVTDGSLPVTIQADVATVSPAGRVTARQDCLLLNVLMVRTDNGWRASAILGQAG